MFIKILLLSNPKVTSIDSYTHTFNKTLSFFFFFFSSFSFSNTYNAASSSSQRISIVVISLILLFLTPSTSCSETRSGFRASRARGSPEGGRRPNPIFEPDGPKCLQLGGRPMRGQPHRRASPSRRCAFRPIAYRRFRQPHQPSDSQLAIQRLDWYSPFRSRFLRQPSQSLLAAKLVLLRNPSVSLRFA